jgi:uroporphyrinogen decarboxylase
MSDNSSENIQKPQVPYSLLLMGGASRLIGASLRDYALNPSIAAKSAAVAYRMFGGAGIPTEIDLSVEGADFGQKIIYPENSTPYPTYNDPLIKDVSDYRKLKRVNLKTAPRMQGFLEYLRILVEDEGFKESVSGFVLSPLAVLCIMRGTERVFRDCILYPKDVMVALDTITEVLVDYAEAQCDIGVGAVVFDILYASQTGLSKELWEKIEGPYVKELANCVRQKSRSAQVHNCGNHPYFDSLIRFTEPDLIDFADLPDDCPTRKDLKKNYGDQIILSGYVDTALLSHGTPDEVEKLCRMQIEDLAVGDKFILTPGCEFPPNASFENALAIVRAATGDGLRL